MSSRQLEQFRQVSMGHHVHRHKNDEQKQQSDEQKNLQQEVDIVKQKNGQIGNRHKYEHVKDKSVGHVDGHGNISEGQNEGHHVKKMEDNFRSVQPLNGRQILDVDTSVKHFDENNLQNSRNLNNSKNILDRTYGDEPAKSAEVLEQKDFGVLLSHLLEVDSDKDDKVLSHSNDHNDVEPDEDDNLPTYSSHISDYFDFDPEKDEKLLTHSSRPSGIKIAKWQSLRNGSDQVQSWSWILCLWGLSIYIL